MRARLIRALDASGQRKEHLLEYSVLGSKMRNSMWSFIKRVAGSRLGHLLLVIHLCLILFYFAQLNDVYAFNAVPSATAEDVITGRVIGGHYLNFDSTLLWSLVAINILPVFLCQALIKIVILMFPHLSVNTISWVQAYQMVIRTSVQWLLVGYFIERMIKLYRASE